LAAKREKYLAGLIFLTSPVFPHLYASVFNFRFAAAKNKHLPMSPQLFILSLPLYFLKQHLFSFCTGKWLYFFTSNIFPE